MYRARGWNSFRTNASEIRRREQTRLQAGFRQFLPEAEARGLADFVMDVTQSVDREIASILRHPRVRARYRYDGRLFTSRVDRLFHTAFDGSNILQWLDSRMIESFFTGCAKKAAMGRIRQELERQLSVAKTRRRNWEEFGTLGIIPDAVLQEHMEEQLRGHAEPTPLSVEERIFFRSFEHQLAG
jgi:hypothetical protein